MLLLEDHHLDAPAVLTSGWRDATRRTELVTVLFTDIVGSTAQAAGMGDAAWRTVLHRHDQIARQELERCGGRAVKSLGDGFLAVFDAPGRAVACAREIVRRTATLGLRVRAGIHAGECECSGDDVAGIAVHIGSRITRLAGPGEVLVTGTVRDLLLGSRLDFRKRGLYVLRGVPGTWRVHLAAGPDAGRAEVAA